uniref:Uncharacterized protein n=1 Tax=Sphaerodactylus townsendi TaxID=933632 RepID=A0ACB8FAL8_9SAUR
MHLVPSPLPGQPTKPHMYRTTPSFLVNLEAPTLRKCPSDKLVEETDRPPQLLLAPLLAVSHDARPQWQGGAWLSFFARPSVLRRPSQNNFRSGTAKFGLPANSTGGEEGPLCRVILQGLVVPEALSKQLLGRRDGSAETRPELGSPASQPASQPEKVPALPGDSGFRAVQPENLQDRKASPGGARRSRCNPESLRRSAVGGSLSLDWPRCKVAERSSGEREVKREPRRQRLRGGGLPGSRPEDRRTRRPLPGQGSLSPAEKSAENLGITYLGPVALGTLQLGKGTGNHQDSRGQRKGKDDQ